MRSVLITLTEPSRASLDLPAFHARWKATIKRLRRTFGITEYGLAAEFQKRGALHPHVIAWAPISLAEDLGDRSSRASYRVRMKELRPLAMSLGWGQVCDAKTIGYGEETDGTIAEERVVRYATKNVADYATKEAAAAFKNVGAKRIRPIRLSRGFYPGGLGRAREKVTDRDELAPSRDPGPWVRVTALATCGAG
jgi:hypothetical protein